jgi:hypothetical protein
MTGYAGRMTSVVETIGLTRRFGPPERGRGSRATGRKWR